MNTEPICAERSSKARPPTSMKSRIANVALSSFQRTGTPLGNLLREIPTEQIFPKSQIRSSRNVGFSEASLRELAGTIAELGLLQPILVRETRESGQFELIAGERRLRAVKLLGHPTVLCRVLNASEHNALQMQRVENTLREGLDRLEQAEAVERDYERLGTLEATAQLWLKSKSWVEEQLSYVKSLTSSSIAQEALVEGVTKDTGVVNQLAALEHLDPVSARATLNQLKDKPGRVNVRATVNSAIKAAKGRNLASPSPTRGQESVAAAWPQYRPVAEIRSEQEDDGQDETDDDGQEQADDGVTAEPLSTEAVLAVVYSLQFAEAQEPTQVLQRLSAKDRHSLTQVLSRAYLDGQRAGLNGLAQALVRKGRRGEISDDDPRLYRVVAFIEGAIGGETRETSYLLGQAAKARTA